jgi:hypothetical protein
MPQLGYKRGLAQPNALGASVPRFVSLAIRTALGSMWHHALQIFRFVCKRKRASRTGRDHTCMPFACWVFAFGRWVTEHDPRSIAARTGITFTTLHIDARQSAFGGHPRELNLCIAPRRR